MESKKVYSNIVLNTINSVLKIIFPFISFKYAAIVLGQENLGLVNYGNSIINYFVLLAGLGISTYAIREGSKIRDDKNKISAFSSEVFTINIISTILSYIILFICIFYIDSLREILILLVVQSSLILFTTLAVEWVYSLYEDYGYIALRNFILQILSLILMFLFVKKEGDYIIFAAIQVISSSGAFIVNYIHVKRKLSLKITISKVIKKHLKPILVLFVNNIAVVIYVNSDTTMIGSIIGMSAVGVYSVSVRIYTMFKTIMSAVVMSVLPNISRYSLDCYSDKKNRVIDDTIELLIVIFIPIIISTIILGKELIILTSSASYLSGYTSLIILNLALIFSISATILTTFYLIPLNLENYALLSTLAAALINIIFNFFLLPNFGINAAAFTTMIAELTVTIISLIVIKRKNIKLFDLRKMVKLIIKGLLAVAPLIIVYLLIINRTANLLLIILLYVVLGGAIYVALAYMLNISIIRNIINNIIKMFKK